MADILARPLRRVFPSAAKALEEKIGLVTVGDLLRYFPRRYIEPGTLTDLGDLEIDTDVTVVARVDSVDVVRMRSRRGSIVNIELSDDSPSLSGGVTATYFNQPFLAKQIEPGDTVVLTGKVTSYRGRLQMSSPLWLNRRGEELEDFTAPIPLYPSVAGVKPATVPARIGEALDLLAIEGAADPLPDDIRAGRGYPDVVAGFEAMHRPQDMTAVRVAQARFTYEEALATQVVLAQRRRGTENRPAIGRSAAPGGLLEAFDAALPFALTGAQRRVGREIDTDLAAGHPMHRLLHGEVGSGKTLVALRAMLRVVDAGGQAALLAPTSVLATQHFHSIMSALGSLADPPIVAGPGEKTVQVRLLTGGSSTAARQEVGLATISGEADIVVGTHALLYDTVKFHDLGLVVVDEQHRFGVDQRDALRSKGPSEAALPGAAGGATGRAIEPHTLAMTATPIPRTVAMTVFGDLDVSVLDELPGGERKIVTHAVSLGDHPGWIGRVFQRVAETIDAGHQAYVVVSRIGEEGSEDLTGIEEARELLDADPRLSGRRLAILHGRMGPAEKDAVMSAFSGGDIDILLATVVIEVGVDVPNATGMVIFDADRFGIAQLHQLRGRIGRGGHEGLCFLLTRQPGDSPSFERLAHVAGTQDGFALSEYDIETRREGDVLGRQQSGGRSTLRLLSVIKHEKIITEARADARAIVEADPRLADHPALKALTVAILDSEAENYIDLA